MIAIDTHTHSLVSGHAYSTLEEMAQAANKKNLTGFVLTDHSPGMPGGPHRLYFYNLHVLPRKIHGALVFRGAEANIIDSKGTIDLDDELLPLLDLVIASFHIPTFEPQRIKDHTLALVNAAKNPYVKVLGHPDDNRYPYDISEVVRTAGETGTLIEMNNSSLCPGGFRQGAAENYKTILAECRKEGVMITVASDAHYSSRVGDVSYCQAMLEELKFPEELIANTTLERFLNVMKITL